MKIKEAQLTNSKGNYAWENCTFHIEFEDPKHWVEFIISNEQWCCESYGVRVFETLDEYREIEALRNTDNKAYQQRLSEMEHRICKELVNQEFVEVVYDPNGEITLRKEGLGARQLKQVACFTLKTSIQSYTVEIFNSHSGCYPHDFWVKTSTGFDMSGTL